MIGSPTTPLLYINSSTSASTRPFATVHVRLVGHDYGDNFIPGTRRPWQRNADRNKLIFKSTRPSLRPDDNASTGFQLDRADNQSVIRLETFRSIPPKLKYRVFVSSCTNSITRSLYHVI